MVVYVNGADVFYTTRGSGVPCIMRCILGTSVYERLTPSPIITDQPGRKYVGIAAQGRSLKVVLLRTYLALLGTSQKVWVEAGGAKNLNNPADPYMTLIGYFNSLRELGGSRRIVEDEVTSRVSGYREQRRVTEQKDPEYHPATDTATVSSSFSPGILKKVKGQRLLTDARRQAGGKLCRRASARLPKRR